MEMINCCPLNHGQRFLSLQQSEGPYTCFGCKQVGSGACYQCSWCYAIHKECNYIHKECARAPTTAFHPFFKYCEFKFYKKAPTKSGRLICDACDQYVLGFSYQYPTHNDSIDLHPCCLNLKHEIESNGVKLTLVDKVDSVCLYCKQKRINSTGAEGWSYVSACKQYCYHVACVKEMVNENLKKNIYSGASTSYTSTTSQVNSSLSLPNHGTITRTNGNNWSRNNYWKIARTLFKVIISAMFGDPIGMIGAFVETFY